jgi:nicotinate-nucleotide adenylyltransferase
LKIGLFGGTFNPVHYGHLINAERVRELFGLDKILFIPSKYPVHKNLEGNIPSEDRFNMLKLAAEDNPAFEVSRIEIDRKDDSYFIITINQLNNIYNNAELYLLIGTDAFNEIHTWKDSDKIIKMVSFIVMKRPGYDYINHNLLEEAEVVIIVENPLIEISSSGIREYIKNNRSIKYLVPLKVEEYIISRELYKFEK